LFRCLGQSDVQHRAKQEYPAMTVRSFRRRATVLPFVAMTITCLAASGAAAQGIPKIETEFANGGKLRFYGQINKGFLSYDDGQVSESYNFIDNNNSNTRAGLTYGVGIGDGWDYLGTLEIQYAPVSTTNQGLDRATGLPRNTPASAFEFTNANIRQIDNRFTNETYGVFYLGQGNMASNDTVKVDFSGTTVIAGVAVQDSAGGQLLRQEDGVLSSRNIGNAFNDYNGLGRRVRIRYDTPSFNGFVFRTSYGQNQLGTNPLTQDDPLYDIALAYTGEAGDFRYGAQTSYSWNDIQSTDRTTTILNGSASILHTPTGLNLTIAGAGQDTEVNTQSYYYVKGGWIGDLVAWGKTAVSIDYYDGTNVLAVGSTSRSTGLAVVQNVTAWNTELWATYRTYEVSNENGLASSNYQDSNALFFGARFRF
jgi:hypothetical protein